MIALCAGMYRSGSTWQYQVVSHLVEAKLGGERLGFRAAGMDHSREFRPLVKDPRWRSVKVHEPQQCWERLTRPRQRSVVVFYTLRDLRDVVYSMVHKTGMPFDMLVQQRQVIELILECDAFWRSRSRVTVQRYEDLIARPAQCVAEIAAALGVALDAGEAEAIAAEYSLAANRKRTARLTAELRRRGADLNDPRNVMLRDEHSELHWNHIRDGASGGWRNVATAAELAEIEARGGEWLTANGYRG